MTNEVTIYTDGGCDPNPGPGGWAALIIQGTERKEITGAEASSTNNRMELTAAIEALRYLTKPSLIDLYTDSQYVKRGITEWMPKWLAKKWRGTHGPIANKDLWQALLTETNLHTIRWHWVKGHSTDRLNLRVDDLVQKARIYLVEKN